jgi:hypothetical protein
MKLNTIERVLLQRILQDLQTDWATLKLKRVLAESLSPTKKELDKLIEKRKIGDREVEVYRWDKVPPREYEIPEVIKNKITTKLDELSKSEKLTDDYYSLMEKFFPEDKPKDK